MRDDSPGGTGSGTDSDAGLLKARSDRAALAVFIAALVAALPVILYKNRDQWFSLDEWDFLASRDLASLHSLMRPHNEHWTFIPVVLYRLLFRVVGLRHYLPYQMLVVTAHLVSVVMLRIIIRRAGAQPWLATAALLPLLYFGPGREDLAWGFQIAFTGALAFGLAALVLADHEGGFNRWDVLAGACGLAALMCSGIGMPMVFALGIATLVKRGWRVALAFVAPLAACFVIWYTAVGQVERHDSSLTATLHLAWNIVRSTFSALGGFPGGGLILAAVLVVGTWLIVSSSATGVELLRQRYASTVGLLGAVAAFLAITSYGRATLSLQPAGRYLHLTAAMILPAIAAAAAAIGVRWRRAVPVLVVLLLVGLPGDIRKLEPMGGERFILGNRPLILALAHAASTTARDVPRDFRPIPLLIPQLTVGWLRDTRSRGLIPEPPATPDLRAEAELILSIEQVASLPTLGCAPRPIGPTRLRRGDLISVTGSPVIGLISMVDKRQAATERYYRGSGRGIYLRASRTVTVAVRPGVQGAKAQVCRRP